MMVSPPSLAIIARYSWLQLKRLVGMTSPNTTPFANFYTDSNRTNLKLYCDRLSYYEKEDLSKLQVGEIEFRTNKMLSGHEYVKLSMSYQGSVVGYAVMEIGLGTTRRSRSELYLKRPTSPSLRDLPRSSVSTQSLSESPSNDFSAQDTIYVSKYKTTVDLLLINSYSLGTFSTFTSALHSSFAKLVILCIAINDVTPRYHLFSTNCYYFVALMLDLMEDDDIMGGEFMQSAGSKMGRNEHFRTMDRESKGFKEAMEKIKGVFMKRWDEFTRTRAIIGMRYGVIQYGVLEEESRELKEETRKLEEETRKLMEQTGKLQEGTRRLQEEMREIKKEMRQINEEMRQFNEEMGKPREVVPKPEDTIAGPFQISASDNLL